MSQPIGVLSESLSITDVPAVRDLLLSSQKTSLTVEGYSMYPALYPGDTVTLEPAILKSLVSGDLVVFQKGDRLLCHRVIAIFRENGENRIKTKGDATKVSDPPIPAHKILGKVVRVERNGLSWSPSATPKSLSLKEAWVYYRQKCFSGLPKASLRAFFIRYQSSRIFRRLYRSLFHPKLTYTVGIPAQKTDRPLFWMNVPYPIAHKEAVEESQALRFFAKAKENVIGSLEVRASGKHNAEWKVFHLFVRARYRGCGVATTLLKQAIQILRIRGALELHVDVGRENQAACALLKRLNFEPHPKERGRFRKIIVFPLERLKRDQELLPFVYHLLLSEQAVSEKILSVPLGAFQPEGAKTILLQSAARQVLFEQLLFELDAALRKEGIPYLVQKGMAIAYLLYPDPATRPMVDIDLYLRKKDISSAVTVLKNLDYEMNQSEFSEELLTFGGELSFQKTGSPIIELHWHLEQYERLKGIVKIDEEALWEKAVTYEISGRKFKTFCPDHQLLYLSIHLGLIHRFQGLKWFLDIDRLLLLHGEDLDWKELFETARRWGIERVVGQVLLATQDLLNTPLPPLLVKKRSFLLSIPTFQWLLLDHPKDRLRVISRAFFPSRDWLVFRYRLKNRSVWPFYRLLHPFLILLGRTR